MAKSGTLHLEPLFLSLRSICWDWRGRATARIHRARLMFLQHQLMISSGRSTRQGLHEFHHLGVNDLGKVIDSAQPRSAFANYREVSPLLSATFSRERIASGREGRGSSWPSIHLSRAASWSGWRRSMTGVPDCPGRFDDLLISELAPLIFSGIKRASRGEASTSHPALTIDTELTHVSG